MSSSLNNARRRELKAEAQHLEATVRLGREGASEAFYRELEAALARRALVKIKFADFQSERKSLAPAIAAKSGSELIAQVGHVAVFYRPMPAVA